jgi:hypothetical protein
MIRLAVAVLVAVLVHWGTAMAASKTPPKPKENWQQPMKLSVVRSNQPGCEPDCPQWIMAEGEVVATTPALFRKLIRRLGKNRLPVLISSPGGNIPAAIEVGRMLRKAGYDVGVGMTYFSGCGPFTADCKLPKEQKGVYLGRGASFLSFCNSACPLILAGGVGRYAPKEAYVGVHVIKTNWRKQVITYRETYRIVNGKKKVVSRKEVGRKTVKTYDTEGIDKSMRKTLTKYLTEMGVSTDLIADMEKSRFDSLYALTPERRRELKLATTAESPAKLLDSGICAAAVKAYYCVAAQPGK